MASLLPGVFRDSLQSWPRICSSQCYLEAIETLWEKIYRPLFLDCWAQIMSGFWDNPNGNYDKLSNRFRSQRMFFRAQT